MAACALLAIGALGCGNLRHADSTDSAKQFVGEKHNIARFNNLDLEVSSVTLRSPNTAIAFAKSKQGGRMSFSLIKQKDRWQISRSEGTLP